MLQDFINKHFFILFTITLFFGMITYGLIGFKSIDELCGIILFILFIYYMFHTPNWEINKVFVYIIGIFIFYASYSLFIESNTKKAILVDFIIQIKPYLAFFCAYQLKPSFNKKQRMLLNKICVFCWTILIPFGIISLFYPPILTTISGHPSNYASAIAALALTYLYTSQNTRQEKIIFVCMLALGLVSARSKYYGFFVFSTFIIFFFSNAQNIKLNFKNAILAIIMLVAISFVAKEKIDLYFIQGFNSVDQDKDLLARFALYATSFLIIKDYIPFGSGFASFGTHASGAYYSEIYKDYGIDNIWGLTKNNPMFIADTYYPSLAQFGIVGICLFALFWIYLCKKAITYFKRTTDAKLTVLVIIISGYFAIENIADATFTSNRGLFFMMFLGLIFAGMKKELEKTHTCLVENDPK